MTSTVEASESSLVPRIILLRFRVILTGRVFRWNGQVTRGIVQLEDKVPGKNWAAFWCVQAGRWGGRWRLNVAGNLESRKSLKVADPGKQWQQFKEEATAEMLSNRWGVWWWVWEGEWGRSERGRGRSEVQCPYLHSQLIAFCFPANVQTVQNKTSFYSCPPQLHWPFSNLMDAPALFYRPVCPCSVVRSLLQVLLRTDHWWQSGGVELSPSSLLVIRNSLHDGTQCMGPPVSFLMMPCLFQFHTHLCVN